MQYVAYIRRDDMTSPTIIGIINDLSDVYKVKAILKREWTLEFEDNSITNYFNIKTFRNINPNDSTTLVVVPVDNLSNTI